MEDPKGLLADLREQLLHPVCPRCRQEVPQGIRHDASLRKDGTDYPSKRRRCVWLALDADGKTWRDYARK